MKEITPENKEILTALAEMYDQYCSDGHLFMSAGEGACSVLEDYELLKADSAGRGNINWDKLS